MEKEKIIKFYIINTITILGMFSFVPIFYYITLYLGINVVIENGKISIPTAIFVVVSVALWMLFYWRFLSNGVIGFLQKILRFSDDELIEVANDLTADHIEIKKGW